MLLTLRQLITKFAHLLRDELFPTVEAEVGELSEPAKRLTAVLAMIPLRRFVPVSQGWNGRPATVPAAPDRPAFESAAAPGRVFSRWQESEPDPAFHSGDALPKNLRSGAWL